MGKEAGRQAHTEAGAELERVPASEDGESERKAERPWVVALPQTSVCGHKVPKSLP